MMKTILKLGFTSIQVVASVIESDCDIERLKSDINKLKDSTNELWATR